MFSHPCAISDHYSDLGLNWNEFRTVGIPVYTSDFITYEEQGNVPRDLHGIPSYSDLVRHES